jgi:hypothetical protein
LFKTGGDSIQREFKEILLKHSRHVQPAILLDIVTNDDGKDLICNLFCSK